MQRKTLRKDLIYRVLSENRPKGFAIFNELRWKVYQEERKLKSTQEPASLEKYRRSFNRTVKSRSELKIEKVNVEETKFVCAGVLARFAMYHMLETGQVTTIDSVDYFEIYIWRTESEVRLSVVLNLSNNLSCSIGNFFRGVKFRQGINYPASPMGFTVVGLPDVFSAGDYMKKLADTPWKLYTVTERELEIVSLSPLQIIDSLPKTKGEFFQTKGGVVIWSDQYRYYGTN